MSALVKAEPIIVLFSRFPYISPLLCYFQGTVASRMRMLQCVPTTKGMCLPEAGIGNGLYLIFSLVPVYQLENLNNEGGLYMSI